MSTNIYILKLEGGKFYVGKTDNVINRYQQHLNGSGSAWTKKYKPIGIEKVIPNASPFEEDKVTKEYMAKYGIENVRGGAYVEVELSEFHRDALNMEIWAAKDLCTTCGRSGHWAKDCYATCDASGNRIEREDDSEEEEESDEERIICGDCDKEFTSELSFDRHSCKTKTKTKGSCYRCGRPGHYSPDCYARTHKDGYDLDSDDD
jgi:predicted GIY-YIG superfamily endonuclease